VTIALYAIFVSVIMHVAWNLMARHVESKCDFLWWGILCHLILIGPISIYGLYAHALWSPELLITIGITSVANSLYFVCLRQAYHYAPVTVVYPLARSSPVLIAVWALFFFDEQLPVNTWIGIVGSVIGLWFLALSVKEGDAKHALPWAIAAALFTSIYSLSDKVATSYLPTFISMLGFVSVGYLFSFMALSVYNKKSKGRVIPVCRPPWRYLIPGGMFIGTSYALVIYAMVYLPAAYVVTLTNAGIVIAVLVSLVLMKERFAWKPRIAAIGVILVGLFLVGFSRA